MLLFSGPRRRRLASQGHTPCMIGLDITAVRGFAPWDVVALWCSWVFWLVLQTTTVFAGPGVRYHGVLGMARCLGGLDIQGFDTLGRTEQAGRDITLPISILKVGGAWCPWNLLTHQRFGGCGEQEKISWHDRMAHSCRMFT
jgi:hypothetical protein